VKSSNIGGKYLTAEKLWMASMSEMYILDIKDLITTVTNNFTALSQWL
jgi:hypothetical protein